MLMKNDKKSGKPGFGLRSTAERLDLYYEKQIDMDEIIKNMNAASEQKTGRDNIYVISNHMMIQTGLDVATRVIIVLPSFYSMK